MSEIDWDKAPIGASHWDSEARCFCNEYGYWRGSVYYEYNPQKNWGTDRYIERPSVMDDKKQYEPIDIPDCPECPDVDLSTAARLWLEKYAKPNETLSDFNDLMKEIGNKLRPLKTTPAVYRHNENLIGCLQARLDRSIEDLGDMGKHPKQDRYRDNEGDDWIDECARTLTPEQFRGAMMFTIGKYMRRMGKKDDITSEVTKIADYSYRWMEYEAKIKECEE